MSAGPKLELHLQPGDVVVGLEPGELVEVQRIAPFGGKLLVEGIGASTRRQVRRPLSFEELGVLTKVRGAAHGFDGDPRAFLLGAEAERIRIAHQFDPLFAVGSNIADPLLPRWKPSTTTFSPVRASASSSLPTSARARPSWPGSSSRNFCSPAMLEPATAPSPALATASSSSRLKEGGQVPAHPGGNRVIRQGSQCRRSSSEALWPL